MYNEMYYKKHEDGSYQSALAILGFITNYLTIQSVVDLGCGMGTWGKAAKQLGIENYIGIDQHEYDGQYMLIQRSCYIQYDLSNKFIPKNSFDIAISLEVAEHIAEQYAEVFISNICGCSKMVLFSAALPEQGGTGHVNEKPCSYWKDLFEIQHYQSIDCIRPYFWDNSNIEIWYKNNCMLYIHEQLYEKLSKKLSISAFPTDIVHPELLTRILRKRGV